MLLDRATNAIILSTADGSITYWNQGAERLYGWSREDVMGKEVHSLLEGEKPAAFDEILQTTGRWDGVIRQRRKDGSVIWVASNWTLQDGGPYSTRIQINTDVTSQKQTEIALQAQAIRYQRCLNEALTGNFIARPDGQIFICNPAFAQMFGFDSVEQAQTANFVSLLRNRKDGAELLEVLSRGEAVERHELEMLHRDGHAVYVVARLVGYLEDGKTFAEMQGYLFNDTKRKRLERQLIQAQKMEGLGTLAGGIAHDFNNILAIILGYTSRLETADTPPAQTAAAIKIIREAVERGAALVQQLLTSARQTEAQFSSVDLNALVHELEKMLQATFPKMIHFDLKLARSLPLVTADRSQIHQVLLNLCVNARDAMPNGGVITVETSSAEGTEVAELFAGAEDGKYGRVRVRDTGIGMTREVKSHIFEPFFSTKERGKGTGLGLSVVYGVVNNHNGFVHVDSEPGAGSTFTSYLPLRRAATNASHPVPELETKRTRTQQTILLVEDEEMLRDLGVAILEGEGYRVLAAKDGVEAVEIFSENADAVGLVVCDLGLPRMGGRDAFMKMKQIRPAVRAIVASGYLEPLLRSEMLKAGVIDTIQKPYDFREMLEKIRSVIGDAQGEDDHPQLF